ncbi:MAG: methyltransferase [Desulfurococcaceae archaeon]
MKVYPRLNYMGDVYRPSDDSWLLTAVLDVRNLRGEICIDLGAGSGVLGIYALLNSICERVVLVDIDENAVNSVEQNLHLNGVHHFGIPVLSDTTFIREGSVDMVLANPPYLPAYDPLNLDVATEGGPLGFEKVLYFIEYAKKALRPGGRLILVYSSLSSPDIVEEHIIKSGFKVVFTIKKEFFFETLFSVECVKD